MLKLWCIYIYTHSYIFTDGFLGNSPFYLLDYAWSSLLRSEVTCLQRRLVWLFHRGLMGCRSVMVSQLCYPMVNMVDLSIVLLKYQSVSIDQAYRSLRKIQMPWIWCVLYRSLYSCKPNHQWYTIPKTWVGFLESHIHQRIMPQTLLSIKAMKSHGKPPCS